MLQHACVNGLLGLTGTASLLQGHQTTYVLLDATAACAASGNAQTMKYLLPLCSNSDCQVEVQWLSEHAQKAFSMQGASAPSSARSMACRHHADSMPRKMRQSDMLTPKTARS